MVLSEYDEQQHIENEKMWSREEGRREGRREGRLEGRREGENAKLLELINKKLAKGKPVSVIAEELEEEEETIRKLMDANCDKE